MADLQAKTMDISLKDDLTGAPVKITPNGELRVYQPNVVNESYSKMSVTSRSSLVNKGGISQVRFRPSIINEQVESSGVLVGVVNPSNIVGQIFQASQDNINSILLNLETTATQNSGDDFESYANDIALQSSWVTNSGTGAILDQNTNDGSANCMSFPLDNGGEFWERAMTPSSFLNNTINFDWVQERDAAQIECQFYLKDVNGVLAAYPLLTALKGTWQTYNIPYQALTFGAGFDITQVVACGFGINFSQKTGKFAFIDNLTFTSSAGNPELNIELYDFGAVKPTTQSLSQVTQITCLGRTCALSSVSVPLLPGQRIYSLTDFNVGVEIGKSLNVPLTIGNYYGIILKSQQNINVFGANPNLPGGYYQNGFAFQTPDLVSPISQIGANIDLSFSVFSIAECYITQTEFLADMAPSVNSGYFVYVEDVNKKRTDILSVEQFSIEQRKRNDYVQRPIFMPKGSKLECYYSDAIADQVTKIGMNVEYLYEPQNPNG